METCCTGKSAIYYYRNGRIQLTLARYSLYFQVVNGHQPGGGGEGRTAYSTVTDLARLRGQSTSTPCRTARW